MNSKSEAWFLYAALPQVQSVDAVVHKLERNKSEYMCIRYVSPRICNALLKDILQFKYFFQGIIPRKPS